MKDKLLVVGVGVALVIATAGIFFPVQTNKVVQELGRIGTQFPHGITVGLPDQSPTNIENIITGTCTLIQNHPGPLVASSTMVHWCDVTDAAAGDIVLASPQVQTASASSSILAGPNLFGSISVVGTGMSSTTGRIAVTL